MQQQDRPGYTPKGPTTGPMRPLIVVMETTDGQGEEPLPGQGEPQQEDAEQGRLRPIPEEESGTPSALPQPDEPTGLCHLHVNPGRSRYRW